MQFLQHLSINGEEHLPPEVTSVDTFMTSVDTFMTSVVNVSARCEQYERVIASCYVAMCTSDVYNNLNNTNNTCYCCAPSQYLQCFCLV